MALSPKEAERPDVSAGNDNEYKVPARAELLQRAASEGSSSASETLACLANALGNEAAVVVMRHPNVQDSGNQHLVTALDHMLAILTEQVRQFAYIRATGSPPSEQAADSAANLADPASPPARRRLTDEELDARATCIIAEATKNGTSIGDSLAATAKALGEMISIVSERSGVSAQELIEHTQHAIAQFAEDALARRKVE
jgi:hypothetical protein